ncbi:MAG: hypothetical protein Q9213_005599 [Squamulea squamosa]
MPPIPPQARAEIIRRREYEDRKRAFAALKEQAKTSARPKPSAPEGERSACPEDEKCQRSTVYEERLREVGPDKQEVEDRKQRDERKRQRYEERKQREEDRRQRYEERRRAEEDESHRGDSVEEALTLIEEPWRIMETRASNIGGAGSIVVRGGGTSRRGASHQEIRRENGKEREGRASIKHRPRSIRRSGFAIVTHFNHSDDMVEAYLLCLCIGIVLGILIMLIIA